MKKKDVCIRYRQAYGADMPTLKLARIMYKENPILFNTVEDARTCLRRLEGKAGGSGKAQNAPEHLIKTEPRPYNPYNLPESQEKIYKPFIIKGHKRVGILTDIHVPYHNIPALTAAIGRLKEEKIDGLLLNGDIIDFYNLSAYEKDPRKRSFASELDAFANLISALKRELDCPIYYKIGNHEERYTRFLHQKASELVGVEEFDLHRIIKSRAGDITIIDDKRIVKLNVLNGIHGHEYKGGISTPVNIARGLYLRGKVSAFQGHNHATSEHTESNMNGEIVTTWSIGCLCELNPTYMPLNKWNHGFAIVDLDENGKDYFFRNFRILNGKVL